MSPAPRDGVREALLSAARAELTEHGRAAISLRAVARRAGVSHAAPKYHFRDRAGLLTAIATEGFHALSAVLSGVDEPDPRRRLAALGAAYVDFGRANPALFELMFATEHLHSDDPELAVAQRNAIGRLTTTARQLMASDQTSTGTPTLALISWALAHGLIALTRHGALQAAAGTEAGHDLAHRLAEDFTKYLAGNDR